MLPVHPRVLPLHGQRTLVSNSVEGPNDLLEGNSTAAEGSEIPEPVRVSEWQVPPEHSRRHRAFGPPDVFHVGIEDPGLEAEDERYAVHPLIGEVRRVEVEPEALSVPDGLQSPLSGDDVEGDLRGVNLQSKSHSDLVEHVDMQHTFAEIVESIGGRVLSTPAPHE